jgi:elongation factor 1 alpha-like protein
MTGAPGRQPVTLEEIPFVAARDEKTMAAAAEAARTDPISLMVAGHIDAGKSTLLGHMLVQLGHVSERTITKFQQEASQIGKGSFAYAWVLDEDKEERERGVTMDVCVAALTTPSGRRVRLLDAPGHADFVPQLVARAGTPDAAVLVVNASTGAFESGFSELGQTREHVQLLRAFGLRRLILAVNKMDSVGWEPARFEAVVAQLRLFLTKEAGFMKDSLFFVPVSALDGENLISPKALPAGFKSAFRGSLADAIDAVPQPPRNAAGHLCAVISDAAPINRGARERAVTVLVDEGTVLPGDVLYVLPQRVPVSIAAISAAPGTSPASATSGTATPAIATAAALRAESLPFAPAGRHVQLSLKPAKGADEADFAAIAAGSALVARLADAGEYTIPLAQRVRVRMVTLNLKTPLLKGEPVDLFLHHVRAPATLHKFQYLLDKHGEPGRKKPRAISAKQSAVVDIELPFPIVALPYARSRLLGRVIMRDGGRTIAMGTIMELKKSKVN